MAKFTIPSECHISRILPVFYKNKSSIEFDFSFTSNCIYDLGLIHNIDCNKLFGVSFGLIHNTKSILGRLFKNKANSFRIGWNCSRQNRKIQLYAYYYNNGERNIQYLTDIDLNRYYNCEIIFDRISNMILLNINSHVTTPNPLTFNTGFDFNFSKCPRFGSILNFYFGGRLPAPHKMTAYINRYF